MKVSTVRVREHKSAKLAELNPQEYRKPWMTSKTKNRP